MCQNPIIVCRDVYSRRPRPPVNMAESGVWQCETIVRVLLCEDVIDSKMLFDMVYGVRSFVLFDLTILWIWFALGQCSASISSLLSLLGYLL